MSDQNPLSQREFDLWREGHDFKVDRIMTHIDMQVALNMSNESRLTAVESGEARNKRVGIGSVVAAIVTAVLAALSTYAGTK